MTVYIVSKSQPDYDCGSAWTSIVNNMGYKTKKSAYDAMIEDMLNEMGLSSIEQVPDKNGTDYDRIYKMHEYGIEDWGIPKDENDRKHKTCVGYVNTCDGEITYDIQTMKVED